jgi:motility quorum-sensing regulator / GCU-specific mRNA interferase toxin
MHPTYPLDLIKGLIKDGSCYITGTALDDAGELGFDEEDIKDCVVNHLAPTHFEKTMPSHHDPKLMQDVYNITYQSVRVYVKLQVNGDAVVISFKQK